MQNDQPNFKQATESLSQIIRWTEAPKDANDKSIFIGTVVTGYYKNMKTDVGQNESNLYELELTDDARTLVSFWGTGLLDGKFEEIPKGCLVRITYKGIAQPKSANGRAYKDFTVEYDASRMAPMKTAAAPSTTTPVQPVTQPTAPAGGGLEQFNNGAAPAQPQGF